MSTYYKYVDRDVDQQINWADVGGQISKSLLDRQADLAKQKAAINKDSTELLSQLNNPELGTNRDINTLMIDGGMKLAQTQKSLNTLFNKRLLSQSEYLQATQNIKTNADTFSKLAKQWNESSEAGHKAITDGKASLATASILGYVEGVFNPNTIATVVDDKGNLFLGSKVVKNIDGVDVISVEAKPGALQSVNNYSALLKTGIVPKYDVNSFAKSFEVEKQKYIKILAEKDPTIYQKGEQFIIDDLKRNPDFMKAVLLATEAESLNPQNAISILFDGAGAVDGNPYEVDFTGKKEGDNIIKARVTSTGIAYDFTDKQKARAQEVLLERVLGKISVEEKKDFISQVSDASLPREKFAFEKQKDEEEQRFYNENTVNAGREIGNIVESTSPEQFNAYITSYANRNGMIPKYDTKTKSFTFSKVNPEDGKLMNIEGVRIGYGDLKTPNGRDNVKNTFVNMTIANQGKTGMRYTSPEMMKKAADRQIQENKKINKKTGFNPILQKWSKKQ